MAKPEPLDVLVDSQKFERVVDVVPTRGQPNDQIQAEIVAPVFQGQLSPVQDGFNPLLLEASLDHLLQGLLDDLRHCVFVIDVHALDADAESAVTRVVVVPSGRRKAGAEQVWSLTQFYSVDFSKSRIDVKKRVFNKRTIKVSRQLLLTVSWDLRA